MAKVVNMPSREVIRSIVGRKRHKDPKRRDVSMNRPHVIDWDKMITGMEELLSAHQELYTRLVDGGWLKDFPGDDYYGLD